MGLVTINWKPDARELRKFGISMIVGFAAVGTLFFLVLDRPQAAIGCYAFGAIAGIVGLTGSKVALPIYWAWMAVAFVMGNIMSRVVLVVFFYLLVTPMGLVRRFFAEDTLQLKRRAVSTYWRDLKPIDDKKRYERQF